MTTHVKALRAKDVTVTRRSRPKRDFTERGFEIKFERRLTEEELMEFSAENDHLRIEEDKNGKIIIIPPVDFDGGIREGRALGYLFNWWLSYQKGEVFSPNAGFKLLDSSTRSPDAAWVSAERLATVSKAERKKFARIAPDFVIEVRSTSDRLNKLKKKMTDTWMKNGVRLAWLIDPIAEKAFIYRQDGSMEEINGFDNVLSGEDVCPGLTLNLASLRI
ncbi:MAG: Uma2 family endonuclease [Haliscomenobacteraceae bacterium CHB4]|nr:Uma2 family endonuclease [Haliscomenobacteraceae bacterium CHB4]